MPGLKVMGVEDVPVFLLWTSEDVPSELTTLKLVPPEMNSKF